jgi:hypothetical protein
VGPTLVVTLLLDGPQLAARWTARYAGVLADDPGSAVLTLTALGMAARSRPGGMAPSRVIAMWKDPVRGMQEIPLEPGAQGVLLKAVLDTSTRHAADGRLPADDATDLYIAGVHQLQAEPIPGFQPGPPTEAPLTPADLSVVSAWAQAVSDAGPDALAAAAPGADWRGRLGLSAPDGPLAEALLVLSGEDDGSAAAGVAGMFVSRA